MGLPELLFYLKQKRSRNSFFNTEIVLFPLEMKVGLDKQIADLSLNTIPPSALLLIVPSSKSYMQVCPGSLIHSFIASY